MRAARAAVLVVCLIVISACGAPAQTGPPATSVPGASVDRPTPTQAPGTTSGPVATGDAVVEEITGEGEVTLGPGPFDFPEPQAGLSGLASYKATLTLSFTGTQTGQPSQWSKTYVMLSTREPSARELTIESKGQTVDPEPVFMAESEGAAYEQRGDGPCAASVIEPGRTLAEQVEPAGFLTGVFGADDAGTEAVEGVAANRYTFDERALGEAGIATSVGELWVAADGGHLVKYALTTMGGADYVGEGIEGTATWAYSLTDVNQPIAIELPADCPAGVIDAPLLPDAADVLNEPGVLSYVTTSTPPEAATFYQAEEASLGWQATTDAVVTDDMALQDFMRADEQLSLTIAAAEEGTTVLIVVGPAEQ